MKIRVENRPFSAQPGATIMECLVSAGFLLRADCGGHGRCGKCLVQVNGPAESGLTPFDDAEANLIGESERALGYRLACRARVVGPVSINIPLESRLAEEVVGKGPLFPTQPEAFRKPPARDLPDAWGVAVDIGTTTLAVYLCDLIRPGVIFSTAVRNPQSIFGDDVISRIDAVRQDPSSLSRMQKMAASAIDWAVSALCRQAGLEAGRISEMVCVGNSIMLHLILGEDPSPIGVSPYTPRFLEAKELPAGAVGLRFCKNARLRTLPLISGYLGADIVSAALAVDLENTAPGTLLVDVGTNGEIILSTRNGFSATSCATGPALEGAAIHHGMQATSGAIDSVRFVPEKSRLEYTTIQRGKGLRKPPAGICGSGVISIAAELLRAGIIQNSGRLNPAFKSDLLRPGENGIPEYVIVPEDASGPGRAIAFTQADVRAVQLAKGALRAGIDLLCRGGGLQRPSRILLAGAFGSYINRSDALQIGMFPEMDPAEIEVVGNAAGAGAVLALLSEEYFMRASEIARKTRVLDLGSHAEFQKTFIDALSF